MVDNPILQGPHIQFNYIKSSAFRVVHADGIYGGISPHGYVHFALYTERPTLPRTSVVPIDQNGFPSGAEAITETKGGLTREVEVDVVVNLTSLVSMHHWLGTKMEQLRLAVGLDDEAWAKMKSDVAAASERA